MKRNRHSGSHLCSGRNFGSVYHSMTTGAVDRARIASLDGELKARNEKLEKCTTALIEGLHPTFTAQPDKTK